MIFHCIADGVAGCCEALATAETDERRSELRAAIAQNKDLFAEAWDAYSVLLRPHQMTNTNFGAISELPPNAPMKVAAFGP